MKRSASAPRVQSAFLGSQLKELHHHPLPITHSTIHFYLPDRFVLRSQVYRVVVGVFVLLFLILKRRFGQVAAQRLWLRFRISRNTEAPTGQTTSLCV